MCKQEIPLRSNVYEVYATDKDEGLNGVVLYNLLKTGTGNKDWEYFSIDSVSGLIQTAMRLDREKQAVYNVSQAGAGAGLEAVGLAWGGWGAGDVVGMGSADTIVEISHLRRSWVAIKCHRGVASWWASTQFLAKSPPNPPPSSCALCPCLSDVSQPVWFCPGQPFCLSLQLIIVACDQGQPPYETMQPLQVALDDIDDNEPIFLRPPVRHQGEGGGMQGMQEMQGMQGWGCQQAHVMECAQLGHHCGVYRGICPLLFEATSVLIAFLSLGSLAEG